MDGSSVKDYPRPETYSFATRGHVELPTQMGTVVVMGRTERPAPYSGTFTKVVLKASAELDAFLPVTGFQLRVDGKPWASLPYGEVVGTNGDADFYLKHDSAGLGSSDFSLCEDRNGTRRKHFELFAHVAGTSSDPDPVAFDADVDCPAPIQPQGMNPGDSQVTSSCQLALPPGDFPVGAAAGVLLGIALLRHRIRKSR